MITADMKGTIMSYNGYSNYQTWNVCLWIANDEGLNDFAASCKDYDAFKSGLREIDENSSFAYETQDGVAWSDSAINLEEMHDFWAENFSNVEA
jgi:hypothetical protein